MDDRRTAPETAVDDLRGQLRGTVVTADDDGYDDARRVWNGMVEKFPLAVVRVADEADVATVVATPAATVSRSRYAAGATGWPGTAPSTRAW
ncbi:hypothetical protein [Georgenia sp. SUBG003]|uniref:hypothetical protein n=1 Tax=Georgenia sp. SUBG003 TaxID=1497974 RepID=UPI003AB47D89